METKKNLMRAVYERMAGNIQKFGQSIIGTEGCFNGKNMAFSYTIGLQSRGFPELLMVGFKAQVAAGVLNSLAKIQDERGKPFLDGEEVSTGGLYPVKMLGCGKKARELCTIQAGQFYGNENYGVMLVLVPDSKGTFPTDPGCAYPYSLQPTDLRELPE
jgi:Domain of unknown function (DUF4262)